MRISQRGNFIPRTHIHKEWDKSRSQESVCCEKHAKSNKKKRTAKISGNGDILIQIYPGHVTFDSTAKRTIRKRN